MINDAIEKIKVAEAAAKKRLEDTKKEVAALEEKEIRDCQEKKEAAMEQVLTEAKAVKEKYEEEGRAAGDEIRQKAEEEIARIHAVDAKKFSSAVTSMVERIVNVNGNS